MINVAFIQDVRKGQTMIYNTYFETDQDLIDTIQDVYELGNEKLAREYEIVQQTYTTPLIIKDSDDSYLWEVLEVTEQVTNHDIVKFCLDSAEKGDYPKLRLSELDNHEEIEPLDDLYDMQVEDEFGDIRICSIDDALWLQDLANAYKKINEEDIMWDRQTINDYDDIVDLTNEI